MYVCSIICSMLYRKSGQVQEVVSKMSDLILRIYLSCMTPIVATMTPQNKLLRFKDQISGLSCL